VSLVDTGSGVVRVSGNVRSEADLNQCQHRHSRWHRHHDGPCRYGKPHRGAKLINSRLVVPTPCSTAGELPWTRSIWNRYQYTALRSSLWRGLMN